MPGVPEVTRGSCLVGYTGESPVLGGRAETKTMEPLVIITYFQQLFQRPCTQLSPSPSLSPLLVPTCNSC